MAASLSCGEKKQTLEDLGIYVTPDTSEIQHETVNEQDIYFAKDKVLVKVDAADAEQVARDLSAEITGYIRPLGWYEFKVEDARKALPQFRQHRSVRDAELNYAGAVDALDIENSQWEGFAEGHYQVKLPEAYGFIGERDLESVTVAVLDSGFDLQHRELDAQFLEGYDFGNADGNPSHEDFEEGSKLRKHGTMVAGIIAMENNGENLNGVAYNAKILPVKIASSGLAALPKLVDLEFMMSFKAAAGITYATLKDADVVNMSIGWYVDEPSDLLRDAAEYAASENVSLIASAGNHNRDARYSYPSSLPQVMSVGAVNDEDKRAEFSNFSIDNDVDVLTLAAPGVRIWSSVPDITEPYINAESGTSFSAPFVSGLDALIKSLDGSLTPAQRRQIMLDSADRIRVAYPEDDIPFVEGERVWNRINAYNAVVLAVTGCNPASEMCGEGMEGESEAEGEICPNKDAMALPDDCINFTCSSGSDYLYCRDRLSWCAAQTACDSLGGCLVTINDAEENSCVADVVPSMPGSAYPSIGFFQDPDGTERAGGWGWVCSSSNYLRWRAGEPNDRDGTSDCGVIWPNGGWDDGPCSDLRAFVCELNPQ